MPTITALMIAMMLLAGSAVGPQQRQQDVDLQSAIRTETVDGDLSAAIKKYRAIVERYAQDRAIVATALVRMAECYQKLGDAEARRIYERVLRDYAEQQDAVVLARSRLVTTEPTVRDQAAVMRKAWTGYSGGTISPDGRFLTSAGNFNTVVLLHDLASGRDRPLTVAPDFSSGLQAAGTYTSAISRDGAHAVFNWCVPDTCELRTVSLRENGIPTPRRLFRNTDIDYIAPMDWSPDGKWIAVGIQRKDRTGQIGLVAVTDGTLRVLKSVDWRGPTRMFFSTDSRDVAFDLHVDDTTDQRDVFVLAVDGSRELAAVAHASNDVVMGWTPDGKYLLFASDRTGSMSLWSLAFTGGRPEGMPELVKANIGNVQSLGLTNRGALYMQVAASNQDIHLASIDFATGKQIGPIERPIQRFTGTNAQPTWSRDGKSLAYVSSRARGTFVIGRQSVQTGEISEVELRPGLRYVHGLSWAPDGQWFAVWAGDLKGRNGIFRIDAESGEVTPLPIQIPENDRLTYEGFFWSPDGGRLYYHRASGSTHEYDLASGRDRVITTEKTGPISLSPDGRWIAAYKDLRKNTTREATAPQSWGFVVISVQDSTTRELLRLSSGHWVNNTSMPWTPDSRAVLVRKMTHPRGETSELWHVPIDGAPARKLDFDANQVTPYASGKMRMHPNGRQLAFVSGQSVQEVWALENFLPARSATK
jgi:Tol biopolymer transport system component